MQAGRLRRKRQDRVAVNGKLCQVDNGMTCHRKGKAGLAVGPPSNAAMTTAHVSKRPSRRQPRLVRVWGAEKPQHRI